MLTNITMYLVSLCFLLNFLGVIGLFSIYMDKLMLFCVLLVPSVHVTSLTWYGFRVF